MEPCMHQTQPGSQSHSVKLHKPTLSDTNWPLMAGMQANRSNPKTFLVRRWKNKQYKPQGSSSLLRAGGGGNPTACHTKQTSVILKPMFPFTCSCGDHSLASLKFFSLCAVHAGSLGTRENHLSSCPDPEAAPHE